MPAPTPDGGHISANYDTTTDMLFAHDDGGAFGFESTGTRFFDLATGLRRSNVPPPRTLTVDTGGFTVDYRNFYPGDFDGDGLADVGFFRPQDNSFHVSKNHGNNSFGYDKAWIASNTFGHSGGTYFTGDFNGDGADDVGFFEPGDRSFWVGLSNTVNFARSGGGRWICPDCFGNTASGFFPADFNGDGKTDLAFLERGGGEYALFVALSDGIKFVQAGGAWIPGRGFIDDKAQIYIGDFTGDGRADVAARRPLGTIQVAVSTGSGFAIPAAGHNWATGFGTRGMNYFTGDFTGDGIDDIAYWDSPNKTFRMAVSTGGRFNIWGDFGLIMPTGQFGVFYPTRAGIRNLLGGGF